MAVTLKADTEDFPSILGLLGLGGLPKAAEASGQTVADSQTKPQEAQPANATGPSKLSFLRSILGGQSAPVDVPAPDLSAGANPGAMPPPDLAQSMAQEQTPLKPTFKEAHPTLSKILGVALGAAQGAAAGAGSRSFGEGFQAGHQATDPYKKKMEDLTLQSQTANIAHQQAVTDAMKTTVQVRDPYGNVYQIPQAQLPGFLKTNTTEQGKNTRLGTTEQAKTDRDKSKNAIALRKQGLTLDEQGNQVPIAYEDMSPSEQAHLDLTHAQIEGKQAQAALARSKNDPNSPSYKLALGRLQTAQQNAATALGKLGLEGKKYLADYFGTDAQGNALPAAATDESGRPIGPRVANAGKIPADRLKRGDLAANAISNLDDIKSMIQDNPDLFGSLSGRITSVKEMLGSDNEVIRQIAIAAHNYALASSGVHGTRSQGAVQKTEDELLNHWKDGANAVVGGINQAQKSLNQFVSNQKLGSRAIPSGGVANQPKATHVYDPATGKISAK